MVYFNQSHFLICWSPFASQRADKPPHTPTHSPLLPYVHISVDSLYLSNYPFISTFIFHYLTLATVDRGVDVQPDSPVCEEDPSIYWELSPCWTTQQQDPITAPASDQWSAALFVHNTFTLNGSVQGNTQQSTTSTHTLTLPPALCLPSLLFSKHVICHLKGLTTTQTNLSWHERKTKAL